MNDNDNKNIDDESMATGIDQILGKMPYAIKGPTPVCNHSDDGHIYDETPTRYVLRCYKCGEFFDSHK